MKIVIDTNVIISGVFFGGYPKEVIEAVKEDKVTAYATQEIIDEYEETVHEMIVRKQGHFNTTRFSLFTSKLQLVEKIDIEPICRDPNDDKFIACADSVKAKYIINGDKDFLYLYRRGNIKIITAKEFCFRYI